jgi:hypothetical protein
MTNIILLAITLHTNYYTGMLQPNGTNYATYLERGEVTKVYRIGFVDGTNSVCIKSIPETIGVVWRTNGLRTSPIVKEIGQ